MESVVIEVGLAAAGVLGVALAVRQALPSRTRITQALTWLVPVVAIWILATVTSDVLVALVLASAALSLYLAMMISPTAQRSWLRTILRSHNPWVVALLSSPLTGFSGPSNEVRLLAKQYHIRIVVH
jgi:hypothetical protein